MLFDFIIVGYPRSRTAWLSVFLSQHQDMICLHEPLTISPKLREKYRILGCSIAEPQKAEAIIQKNCNARVVVIDRKIFEAQLSADKFLWNTCKKISSLYQWQSWEYSLRTIKHLPDTLIIKYNEIDSRLREIWDFCTDCNLEYNPEKAETLSQLNIQVDQPKLRERIKGYVSMREL